MKKIMVISAFITGMILAADCLATGLATCESDSRDEWQSQEKLEQILTEKGWKVRRIKVDGGCYEAYALDNEGKRVEAYFHPVTLEPVATEKD